ncbi:hypothetical protein BU24DRAFT_480152 [Aaosphaeria arxii CBS 175.79]|uniref:Cora-domain-containing protein n=1 Tax=Aaosphaeria arxii CBS 175.79 TaxID=1450172 RepID=A0A6A5XQB3_9PLEO|nr:uncharacterized protein BU24DRAFT_480152 [Aaosphaeria arxii CBS 175.79]KAF2015352.1 hypothetical protein BU24DRAFT_480152 [Aaosphaeria arxii CBS 175.79]
MSAVDENRSVGRVNGGGFGGGVCVVWFGREWNGRLGGSASLTTFIVEYHIFRCIVLCFWKKSVTMIAHSASASIGSSHSNGTAFSKSWGATHHFLSEEELEYMGLIQDQIQPFFPEFAAAVANQTAVDRERGRCALVDLSIEDEVHTAKFASSEELDRCLWKASTRTSPDARPQKRLFILEDLPCHHILALGSRLRIPPTFFASQWDDPASSTFNHRSPFRRYSKAQFCLRYATSHRVEVDAPNHANSSIYAFNANVCRYLHTYSRNGLLYDEARSHHTMSFWSSPVRPDGSWDAVLLVDPPLVDYVQCLPSRQIFPLRPRLRDEKSMPKHFLNPEMNPLDQLPENSAQWERSYVLPGYTSLFDDTIQMMESEMFKNGHDIIHPIDVVTIPRKWIISTLTSFMRRRYLNLISIQKSSLKHEFLSSFSEGSLSSWNNEFFNFIVGSCAAMKQFSHELSDNMIAVGVDTPAAILENNPPRWEIDGWRSIQDLTRAVDGMANALATGYLNRCTIQEARVSNGNAQSLSRITVLTMLFIPLSTVASIFSMGGDFLPGQQRAWVFWVVSFPVLALLAYLYWQQQLKCQINYSPRPGSS